MSKRAWPDGERDDNDISPKRARLDLQKPVGADYMHADAWGHVIDWLDWEDNKHLVACGNKFMIKLVARAVRDARIAMFKEDEDDCYKDTAVLRLLHDSTERLNLRSIYVSIAFEAYEPTQVNQILVWNRIAPHLKSVVNIYLLLNTRIAIHDSDYVVTMPPNSAKLTLHLSEKDYRAESYAAALRLCKIFGCAELTDVDIVHRSPTPLSLYNLHGLQPTRVMSLSLSKPPTIKDFFFSFINLIELSIGDVAGFIRATCPPSVTKLKLSESRSGATDFVQDVVKFLPPGNRITDLTLEYFHHGANGTQRVIDHLQTLSKLAPSLQSYELLRRHDESRLCAPLSIVDYEPYEEVASTLNNMPLLKRVPFELFNDNWHIWCAVYSKLTESRRHQLELSFGNHCAVVIDEFGSFSHCFESAPVGTLTRISWVGDVQVNIPMPSFPSSLHTIKLAVNVYLDSTMPLTCLKTMPFLKKFSAWVTVMDGSTARPSADQWVKQTIPPCLASLSLRIIYGTVYDPPLFEDVGISWLPPSLTKLRLMNVLPVKRMVDVLPPSVTALKMEGYWVFDNTQMSVGEIEGVQLLDAQDLCKTRDGNWRKSLSLKLCFKGLLQFDHPLQSLAGQMMERADELVDYPASLKLTSRNEQELNEDSTVIHSVLCPFATCYTVPAQ